MKKNRVKVSYSSVMKIINAAALLLLMTAAAAAASEAVGCTEEVTSFSACLPYVSNPPNNLTESASEKCCKAFSSGVESLCLCHLFHEPLILGFPLNTTRLLSLSSICLSQTSTSTSLAFLCSVSPALPPLNTAPIQTIGTSGFSAGAAAAGGANAGGGRSGSGSGSFGRRVPTVTGNVGSGTNNVHSSSYSSNAPTFTLLSIFLSILVTLLNNS